MLAGRTAYPPFDDVALPVEAALLDVPEGVLAEDSAFPDDATLPDDDAVPDDADLRMEVALPDDGSALPVNVCLPAFLAVGESGVRNPSADRDLWRLLEARLSISSWSEKVSM